MITHRRIFIYTASWLMVYFLVGCAPERINSHTHNSKPPPPRVMEKAPQKNDDVQMNETTSRETASLELVHQAQRLLLARDPHSAIRTLEKALQLNPVEGQNYFFMAEAWILLKQPHQALEYHRLAIMYLSPHVAWQEKLLIQKKKITALSAAK